MAAPVVAAWRPSFEPGLMISRSTPLGLLWDRFPPPARKRAQRKPCETCDLSENFSADALNSLVLTPTPSLSYLNHYVFDEVAQMASE